MLNMIDDPRRYALEELSSEHPVKAWERIAVLEADRKHWMESWLALWLEAFDVGQGDRAKVDAMRMEWEKTFEENTSLKKEVDHQSEKRMEAIIALGKADAKVERLTERLDEEGHNSHILVGKIERLKRERETVLAPLRGKPERVVRPIARDLLSPRHPTDNIDIRTALIDSSYAALAILDAEASPTSHNGTTITYTAPPPCTCELCKVGCRPEAGWERVAVGEDQVNTWYGSHDPESPCIDVEPVIVTPFLGESP